MSLETYTALVRMHEQIGPLKKELKALARDIKKVFKSRDLAESSLFLVVEAINQGRSPKEIKKIAVRGIKACKEKVYG